MDGANPVSRGLYTGKNRSVPGYCSPSNVERASGRDSSSVREQALKPSAARTGDGIHRRPVAHPVCPRLRDRLAGLLKLSERVIDSAGDAKRQLARISTTSWASDRWPFGVWDSTSSTGL